MIETYYSEIQFLSWVLLLVTGCYLLLGKVPEPLRFKPYHKSRRIMAIAFFVYGAQFFLQWKFNVRDEFPMAASALNVTFFYLAALLLGLSFISLLDERYLNRRRVVRELAGCLGVAAVVWGAILFLPETSAFWVLIAAAAGLFLYVAHLSYVFFRTYRACVKKIHNYYSDEVDAFIRWISKSVFLSILMGLLCSTMAFAPKWMICLYLISSVPFFYYIFSCFLDYMIDSEVVGAAIVEDEPAAKAPAESLCQMKSTADGDEDRPQNIQQLERHIQEWIAAKGYLCHKLNLAELAKQMDTNRSYLSDYINSKYSCTFYKWIADLRIEDAKALLLEDPGLTVAQVADQAGFSSSSHFINLFTEKEKLSPAKWREENGKR